TRALQRTAAPVGNRTVHLNLLATVAADRAFPAAVAELRSLGHGTTILSRSTMQRSTPTLRARCFSLLEFAVAVFIVLGHNIFHILPNEVPILFVLGWISLRWRNGGWKAAGLTRPDSWWKIVAFAVGAALVLL